jgi:two-component system response regulator DesR
MIRIVIGEDQGLLRGALATLLGLEDDMEVVAQAANGEELLQLIRLHRPDVCVADIEMPVKTGLDVAEELHRAGDPCRMVILTTFARPGYFQRAIGAGVAGYLLKDSPSDQLVRAIRDVCAGKRVIAPELSLLIWEKQNPLTEREQEILGLAAQGLNLREIGAKLYLSHGTVRNYMSDIMAKLEAGSRIEAVDIARSNGWIR